jgi:hypothetical protein
VRVAASHVVVITPVAGADKAQRLIWRRWSEVFEGKSQLEQLCYRHVARRHRRTRRIQTLESEQRGVTEAVKRHAEAVELNILIVGFLNNIMGYAVIAQLE